MLLILASIEELETSKHVRSYCLLTTIFCTRYSTFIIDTKLTERSSSPKIFYAKHVDRMESFLRTTHCYTTCKFKRIF